ncbi:MAG: histidinol dehydrogenase [Planctomycetota bacterium]
MTAGILKMIDPTQLPCERRSPVDDEALAVVRPIIDDVNAEGEQALRRYAETLDGLSPGTPLVAGKSQLSDALGQINTSDRDLLERVAGRIRSFADAQRNALSEVELSVSGGRVGHRISPVDRAGCYAPGGRHPLPSSVLMTAIPARVAGVAEVIVASPNPAPITLAAAAVAGADAVLAVGGAQAIAAMAFGVGVSVCDVIAGPGNRYVTAAKYLLSDRVGIDVLAGPSELVVLADETADASLIAADLLAQAEHDPDARAMLVTTDRRIIDAVNAELVDQLASLATAEVARAALVDGVAALAADMDEAVSVCDRIAPEHLALHVRDAEIVAGRVRHFGALFVGAGSAEVLGDYAAGPNHTLPTGGAARHTGGLSVLDFLRVRTYVQVDDLAATEPLIADAEHLARLEGLEAHARSATRRRKGN